MLMNILTRFMMVIFAGIALPAIAANYKIDPMHTNVRFTLDHFATSSNVGGFYNLNGIVHYDANTKTGSVDISIPLTALNTGRSTFDAHLQSREFFNIAQYPIIRFASSDWVFDKNGKVRALRGQLTIVGKTHPVALKASKFNCYYSKIASAQVCGGDFEGIIDRSQWGIIAYLKEMPASRYVKLNIQVEAIRQ
jgi:polyisoprenoid-binding protein YceI